MHFKCSWSEHVKQERSRDKNFIFPASGTERVHVRSTGSTGSPSSNRLLAIRIETNTSCNLCCRYCYAQSGEDSVKIADFNALKQIISEAKEL